jgi:predicted DNA-binding transcriptional regulator YafY
MAETAGRLLRLLSLLQSRRRWSGAELAERLDVNVRTIRRDVERLRGLGYTVQSSSGTAGGYELEAGANLPPLLLDDEEAVAVGVGLWSAATTAVTGIEETSTRALLKLNQVLPARLRSRVAALHAATDAVPPDHPSPNVDPDTLAAVAAGCRDSECMRFDYRDHDGTSSSRLAEPHRLVTWGRRWYLLAWDLDRHDWRTFRVDRIGPRTTGPRFTPRDLPDGDAATFVSRGVSATLWRYHTTVTVHAPAAGLAEKLPASVGVVEAVDESISLLHTGAESLDTLAVYLGMLDADFEITDPPELVDRVRTLGARYARAVLPR